MWISDADESILSALDNNGIDVIVGIPNSKLKEFDNDNYAAKSWFRETIKSHPTVVFTHIVVGDMSNMTDDETGNLVGAMESVVDAVKDYTKGTIKVSTVVDNNWFNTTYNVGTSPSSCQFKTPGLFKGILRLLKDNGAPLFIKIMPYFEMTRVPVTVHPTDANFLLQNTAKTFLTDNNGTEYTFVFDAMVDSFFGAMKQLAFDGLKVVVASGWPRKAQPGDTNATTEKALTYNTNLIEHVKMGTPMNGGTALQTIIWSAFDEDGAPGYEGWKHLGAFVFAWNKETLP